MSRIPAQPGVRLLDPVTPGAQQSIGGVAENLNREADRIVSRQAIDMQAETARQQIEAQRELAQLQAETQLETQEMQNEGFANLNASRERIAAEEIAARREAQAGAIAAETAARREQNRFEVQLATLEREAAVRAQRAAADARSALREQNLELFREKSGQAREIAKERAEIREQLTEMSATVDILAGNLKGTHLASIVQTAEGALVADNMRLTEMADRVDAIAVAGQTAVATDDEIRKIINEGARVPSGMTVPGVGFPIRGSRKAPEEVAHFRIANAIYNEVFDRMDQRVLGEAKDIARAQSQMKQLFGNLLQAAQGDNVGVTASDEDLIRRAEQNVQTLTELGVSKRTMRRVISQLSDRFEEQAEAGDLKTAEDLQGLTKKDAASRGRLTGAFTQLALAKETLGLVGLGDEVEKSPYQSVVDATAAAMIRADLMQPGSLENIMREIEVLEASGQVEGGVVAKLRKQLATANETIMERASALTEAKSLRRRDVDLETRLIDIEAERDIEASLNESEAESAALAAQERAVRETGRRARSLVGG